MSCFPQPLFIKGGAGDNFALYLPAEGTIKGSIVYVPPFAEEMNRCRHIVSRQARELARQGHACLVLDLYGTGDSAGEFSDASWDIWKQDVKCAADWLMQKTGTNVTLWGMRLGALIAADVANSIPQLFSRLLMWQPVIDGKLFLTQYLRLRVAFLMDNNLQPETTDSMRQSVYAGQPIEVSGYTLANPLVADLDNKRLTDFDKLDKTRVDWFEHVAEEGKPPSFASKRIFDHMTKLGCHLSAHTFVGPPMWQLHRRDEIPDLIAQTTALFGNE